MSGKTINVAVVDDDASIRLALGRLLGAAGFNPVSYSSAEEFLEDTMRDQMDCLLLDIHLGGMSGFDLHKQLAASGVVPPVIFITARDGPAAREQARQTQCAAFFCKPVRGTSLLEAVRRSVGVGKTAAD
jgi:FixJ family two-component response regulator